MSPWYASIISFLCILCCANAQDNSTFDSDPYLAYRPSFARSLPIQILLTGVVVTLVAVLLIHLVFTVQYHWPLAPVNYVLQLSAVTTLLISLIATIHVVLSAAAVESQQWPYMLSYIAVGVPPMNTTNSTAQWSVAGRATWLFMNASTSGLIQITHIQFLTLLYPSRLEGRLIFALLGPLAILAAIMQLLPLHNDPHVNEIADAVRNVCNATLSLLFTASLFIWGFLVNRRQAWRLEGGTAAFGIAALSLALLSTALNFLYVPSSQEYVWLPALMWAVVLWQSFLGWWWWVGAGSGSGLALVGWEDSDALEEMLKKGEKRERRRKEKERRKEMANGTLWSSVSSVFRRSEDGNKTRRKPSRSPSSESVPSQMPPLFSSSTTARLLPPLLRRWLTSVMYAHWSAARKQDVERVERIRETRGWGLGSFGWRIRREREWREEVELQERRRGRGSSSRNSGHDRDSPVDGRPFPETGNDPREDDTSFSKSDRPVDSRVIPADRPTSMWWWGPLKRWRLQDSTVY